MIKSMLLSMVLLVFMTFAKAMAAPVWYELPYDHFSKDESLLELLMDFSSTIGVPVVISDSVKENDDERVNGHFKETTAEMFLMRLSSLYQIVWYFDGHMLYINHAEEMQSELLHFNDAKTYAVKNTLKRLGVWDPRFNWREMKDKNLLFISGPPRYIKLVKDISELIDRNLRKKKDTSYTVKVFPLKYAWADNRTIAHRGSSVTIPGVASTLQKILGGYGYAGSVNDSSSKSSASEQETQDSQDSFGEAVGGSNVLLHRPGAAAYIEANSQQNAVIVYDLASRIELYDKLIQTLDVPVEQIEIEVSIIDISTERMSELGVDWQTGGKNGTFGFGNIDKVSNLSQSGITHTVGSDSNLTSILSGDASYFLGKIRLLEDEGDGQVLSQPSVMTLNNVEAIIDHSTTFFVKLEGQDEVDLVEISAGSVLRVTPRIINESPRRRIGLDVAIEDGQVSSGSSNRVDDLPLVTRSTITTQAVIGEESSLLVGGYYFDDREENIEKVPFLGDLPIVKTLFTRSDRRRVKLARLFLITPRIVQDQVAYEKGGLIRDRLESQKGFEEDMVKYETPNHEIIPYASPDMNIYD